MGNDRSRPGPAQTPPESPVRPDVHPLLSIFARTVKISGRVPDPFLENLVDFFRRKSAEGEPQVPLCDVVSFLENFTSCSDDGSKLGAEALLTPEVFIETRRFFQGIEIQRLYSLRVPELSTESIVWVVRSMERLRLMPTDKNVSVRLKEILGTEIESCRWKKLMRLLFSDPQALARANQQQKTLGCLTIERCDKGFILGIKGLSWVFEDKMAVEDQDADYQCFLSFVSEFLSVEGRASQVTAEPSASDIMVWISFPAEQKTLVRRAITNGNFGFSNFVKVLGPEKLRKLSLGKISAFVRTSFHNQVLVHHSKFTILNPNSKSQERNLRLAQKTLVSLLEDRPQGIVLSRLPSLLSQALGRPFDFATLGFSKFKQFVASLGAEVAVVESCKNHTVVQLARFVKPPLLLKPESVAAVVRRKRDGSRLLLNLCTGLDYERKVKAILRDVIQTLPPGASAELIEKSFAEALGSPLDLGQLCCTSVSSFIDQSMGRNIYDLRSSSELRRELPGRGQAFGLQKNGSISTDSTASPRKHFLGHCPRGHGNQNSLSLSGEASDSVSSGREALGEREIKRLNDLLNDDE